jgi:hypothetical protein
MESLGFSRMNLEFFKKMKKEGILKYLEFLLWQYRVVDSLWFLSVEETYGRQCAEKLNEKVWAQLGSRMVKDIRKAFEIKEGGLEGMYHVLRLFPWSHIGEHNIQKTDKEIILSVSRCPPQVARLKQGLGEYDCKEMHSVEFTNAAKEVDRRIKVLCEFAPPDPHPKELFCKWRFTL